jgi:uncharacterized protein YifE (UPF0438 family)
MTDSAIRFGAKPFNDVRNFRYGIRRSGHFSISESYELEKYGDTLYRLANGFLSPENDDEIRFVSVCKGDYPAEKRLEKLWLKYLAKSSPTKFHTLFGNRRIENNSASSENSEVAEVADLED